MTDAVRVNEIFDSAAAAGYWGARFTGDREARMAVVNEILAMLFELGRHRVRHASVSVGVTYLPPCLPLAEARMS